MSIKLTHFNSEYFSAEPPDEFKDEANPLLVLLREHLEARGIDRLTMAKALANVNLEKARGRIDQVLDGRRFMKDWFDKIVAYLEIPDEETESARRDEAEWRARRGKFKVRRKRLRSFAKLGPYVYALPQPDWRPSLLGIAGDGYLYRSIPPEVLGDAEAPEMEAILEWIHAGLGEKFTPAICSGFLVHLQPEEIRFFSHDGELIKTGDVGATLPPGTKEFLFG